MNAGIRLEYAIGWPDNAEQQFSGHTQASKQPPKIWEQSEQTRHSAKLFNFVWKN